MGIHVILARRLADCDLLPSNGLIQLEPRFLVGRQLSWINQLEFADAFKATNGNRRPPRRLERAKMQQHTHGESIIENWLRGLFGVSCCGLVFCCRSNCHLCFPLLLLPSVLYFTYLRSGIAPAVSHTHPTLRRLKVISSQPSFIINQN